MRGGVSTSRRGEEVGKVCEKVNMVQILCTHVCKWKNYSRNWGHRGIKENDGEIEFNYDIL
jgi:hypothetical protein